MSSPAAIRNALIAKLGADAALLAQATNGVYYKEGPPGATRLVVVEQVDAVDEWVYQHRAIEDRLYMVEARMLKGSGGDVDAAALRIDALLDPQPPAAPATLTVPGYTLMEITRESPIDDVERDEAEESIIWYRRGGNYRVRMSLGT